jgi:hypothetical protein
MTVQTEERRSQFAPQVRVYGALETMLERKPPDFLDRLTAPAWHRRRAFISLTRQLMKNFYCCLLLATVFPTCSEAIEIATGKMLGKGHDARSFYVKSGGGPWAKTYAETKYRAEAAGRLMNVRVAQGLFHDEWLTEQPFDPDQHTARLIAALDAYREHGILAISVSLQGANMEYGRSGLVKRQRDYKLGPGKGALVSAFRPDGSLKEAWMKRLLHLQRELDRRGMMLDLIYYYARQDDVLTDPAAVDQGVRNVTDWLIANNCRNVIIEIANEHDVGSFDHGRYIHEKMGWLIELARSRFKEKDAPFVLPISASTSTGKNFPVFAGVREHADLAMIHGNNKTPEFKRERIAELVADAAVPGPIYMNEDNNGRETTPNNLARELASCDAVFQAGGSWGYMPWVQLQVYPFRHFMPSPVMEVMESDPPERRDPAYFHAVLEHIRKLVETPRAAGQPCALARQGRNP